MDTSELIKTLAANTRRASIPLPAMWWVAVAIAISIAAVIFFVTLGLRPDIAAAAETVRFPFKLLVTLTLAVSAFGCVRALSRPEVPSRRAVACLAAAPALIVVAVVAELFVLPSKTWSATMIGTNSIVCLTYIPLIGLGPLAIFLLALRHGAPTKLGRAGAIAGLLAGGIAASFYAAQCNNDSPLFVSVWYTIAIAGLAILGAVGARQFARW
jgi:hypothetical protein